MDNFTVCELEGDLSSSPGIHKSQFLRSSESRPEGKPRVLMIGPGPKVRGGINSVIATYVESPLSQKYSFTWLSTYDDRGSWRKIIAALRAYLIGPLLIHRADIVHVHGVFRKSFLRKLPLILVAKAMRKNVIYQIHATTEGAFDWPFSPMIRWTLSSVDTVIALSQNLATSIRSLCPLANILTLPNPVVVPSRINLRPTGKKEPRILFLGALTPQKGFTDLLSAIPAVLKIVPGAQFIFAGGGSVRHAKQLAAELNVTASVTFPGFVRGASKTQELRSAAIFCLPSYNEAVPMALLEGMSYGIPVVATAVGGIPDLICSGKNGLLVSPADIAGLSGAIVSLLADPDLAASIGNAGFDYVARFHGVQQVSTRLDGIYKSLCSGQTPENAQASRL